MDLGSQAFNPSALEADHARSRQADGSSRAPPTAKRFVIVSNWRCCSAQDGRGVLVYFDPYLEDVSIRALTGPERADRLTSPLSVSALDEDEAPLDLDYVPNHRDLFDGTS